MKRSLFTLTLSILFLTVLGTVAQKKSVKQSKEKPQKLPENCYQVAYQANDWYSKFIVRAYLPKNRKKLEKVMIFIHSRYQPDKVFQDAKWQDFAESNDIGIISLEYKYQGELIDRNGKKLKPLHRRNPEKISQLMESQLQKEIKKLFPRARKFGYVNGSQIEQENWKKLEPTFLIAENNLWKAPEKSIKQPLKLFICSHKGFMSKMLEDNMYNRRNKQKISFVCSVLEEEQVQEEKRENVTRRDLNKKERKARSQAHGLNQQKVDVLIKKFILVAFDNTTKKGIEAGLFDENLMKGNSSIAERENSTWLPDSSLFPVWSGSHMLRKGNDLKDIDKVTIETDVAEQPELNIYLKLPNTGNPIKGVMCVVTWKAEEQSMINTLRHKGIKADLVTWAEKNDFALVTWNTVTLWKTGTSEDELERKMARSMDNRFDKVASAWRKGMGRLAQKHKLPDSGYFIYGISRGAHWGHRLVLRNPSWFHAAHFHIANSYDVPNETAKDLLWLITTGDSDGGNIATRKFFERCKKLDYPIVMKSIPNQGHGDSEDAIKLSQAFFNYAIGLRGNGAYGKKTSEKMIAEAMRRDLSNADYVGDLINHGVYKAEDASWLPEKQKMALPNRSFTAAWGKLEKH